MLRDRRTGEPGRRPYDTIIPGLLLRDGELVGPFGVMGGFIQDQAHMQLVSSLADEALDPQAALDKPRFRVEGEQIFLEGGCGAPPRSSSATGSPSSATRTPLSFGGGQAIMRTETGRVGGSDPRKDGYGAGF